MKQINVIAINGICGSGKTTLARTLKERTGIELISKDDLKEKLFEVFSGFSKFGKEGLDVLSEGTMFYTALKFFSFGTTLMIESNFKEDNLMSHLKELNKTYKVNLAQVICQCDAEIALDRYLEREKTGKRHECHFVKKGVSEKGLPENYRVRDISFLKWPGDKIIINTSDFSCSSYQVELDQLVETLLNYKK